MEISFLAYFPTWDIKVLDLLDSRMYLITSCEVIELEVDDSNPLYEMTATWVPPGPTENLTTVSPTSFFSSLKLTGPTLPEESNKKAR